MFASVRKREKARTTSPTTLGRERLDDREEFREDRVAIACVWFPQRFALLADALDRLVDVRPRLLSQDLAEEVPENADVHAKRLIELGGWMRREESATESS